MHADFEHCALLVREADRDRYLATLFAPAAHRDALYALFAFNSEIVRVREKAHEPMPGEIRLQWWRDALAGERDGEAAAHPVAAALRETLKRYGINADRLSTLIGAHAFDLYDEPMATLKDLEKYASQIQGALFAIAAEILSAPGAAAEALTRHTGIAYAIAGVLRGFGLHVSRRQLYLPLEVLERHGVKREDIFAGQGHDSLRGALAEMRAHVRHHLAAARAELDTTPPEILPALLPAATVGPALRRMERRGYEPFVLDRVPGWRRQWWLWRGARDPSRIFKA